MAGRWYSLGTPVYSSNKTDCHDITEILLKVALNTINQIFSVLLNSEYREICKAFIMFFLISKYWSDIYGLV